MGGDQWLFWVVIALIIVFSLVSVLGLTSLIIVGFWWSKVGHFYSDTAPKTCITAARLLSAFAAVSSRFGEGSVPSYRQAPK